MAKSQPKIQLPPATQADYEAGRAALLAMMLPEARARAEAFYADPENQKKLAWKSINDPDRSPAQLAAAAKQAAANKPK